MFAEIQKNTFVKVLGIAGQVLREHKIDQVITAARETLEKRRLALREEWEKAPDCPLVARTRQGATK